MNIFGFIRRWFQKRELARLTAENCRMANELSEARHELKRSSVSGRSIGQLRKLARRHPYLAELCQAELNRRRYNGRLKLNRDAVERFPTRTETA